ncbi:triphosphoribosyl-dephospho-CoA synthase CitG [Loigolactobacillus zhaoyuanensis]|uniref:Probable 2-(5''-triphosphoribosyl)-3'-dephosphocoenzyme-A synthase n=1 Tax=Loigolactobacillus zhaoyuanensis TaxID=2486017 RepID=A0ABW8UC77_9LACO
MLAADRIVQNALKALLYEVSVTPKPGLVDPQTHGAHPDMTVFTFIDSTLSLERYFQACVQAGQRFAGSELTQLFIQIRPLGVQAEKDMFAATSNVNTHKGAIFSLGVLVTAVAYLTQVQATFTAVDIQTVVKKMLVDLVENDFKQLQQKIPAELTAGERHFLKYGKTGIRGEAQAGFPSVFQTALPFLTTSTGSVNQRLLDTLMHIAQCCDDSNLIKRAGDPAILIWVRQQTQMFFTLGGSKTIAGTDFLRQLDATFTAKKLSLGGSADLLILTIFLGLTFDAFAATPN